MKTKKESDAVPQMTDGIPAEPPRRRAKKAHSEPVVVTEPRRRGRPKKVVEPPVLKVAFEVVPKQEGTPVLTPEVPYSEVEPLAAVVYPEPAAEDAVAVQPVLKAVNAVEPVVEVSVPVETPEPEVLVTKQVVPQPEVIELPPPEPVVEIPAVKVEDIPEVPRTFFGQKRQPPVVQADESGTILPEPLPVVPEPPPVVIEPKAFVLSAAAEQLVRRHGHVNGIPVTTVEVWLGIIRECLPRQIVHQEGRICRALDMRPTPENFARVRENKGRRGFTWNERLASLL
jgi:hypothetical protein